MIDVLAVNLDLVKLYDFTTARDLFFPHKPFPQGSAT